MYVVPKAGYDETMAKMATIIATKLKDIVQYV